MILFWGLLSLLQITFLPGAIAIRFFKNKHLGLIEKLVFSFALSLIINYVSVLLLTTLGFYQRWLVILVFVTEISVFIWLYRDIWTIGIERLSAPILVRLRDVFGFLAQPGGKTEQAWQKLARLSIYIFLLLGAISSLVWITNVFIANRLTVFSVWDSVVSWNAWATDWFNNQIPDLTRRYGQLIPANWSLSYVFIGSAQIQFFAKSIMPLFTLFILALMVNGGIKFKSYGYFAAAIFTQLMFKKFLGEHVYSGYVDTAVSFFSFTSLYCLLKASTLTDKHSIKSFLALGAILAGGAFCTKQPGLFVLVAYPILAFFTVIQPNGNFTRRDVYFGLIYPLGLALAFSLPWYIYTEISIYLGINKTEFAWILEEVHRGRTLWERFVLAVVSLEKYVALFFAALVSLPFLKKPLQWITLLIILPYSIFWALFASYSHRNLAIVFPLLALVSGLGSERLIEFGNSALARINFKKVPILLVAVLALALGLFSSLFVADSKFIDLQVNLQKDILIRGLNRELYEYFDSTQANGPILSGYPLEFLPGFEDLTISDSFKEYATYVRHRNEYPEIEYLLMPKSAGEQIFEEVM
ncbi:MAG: hypothetical protein M1347_06315 [Chloroflexi bacterium]|nr:hypothetical protein [Chloroflexota bacterium]